MTMPVTCDFRCGQTGATRSGGAGGHALAALLWAGAVVTSALANPAAAYQTNNVNLPVIPFVITNNFQPNAQLYVHIVGYVADKASTLPTGTWVYVSDGSGNVQQTPALSTTYQVISPLGPYSLGLGQTIALNIPKLSGARVYVSFGAAIQVCCNGKTAGTPPSYPAGWSSGDPNYSTVFDWAEYTWDNTGNATFGHKTRLGGNVTQVDMFGLPLLLTFNGLSTTSAATSSQNAGFTQSQSTILSAFQQLTSPWTDLLVPNATTPLRIVAPYHAIQSSINNFPSNGLDAYIGQVFTNYAAGSGNSIQVTGSCGQDGGIIHTFQGTTSGGVLTFKENGTAQFQFPQPSTLTVYLNALAASPTPSTPLYQCLAGVVAAKLGGAFVRTNLIVNSNLDACQTSQFFVNAPIQEYNHFFHVHSFNHLAYSIGYDDTCNQSSYITIDDPSSATLAVGGGVVASRRSPHDFNADGMSDILWRDTSGNTAAWLMNGSQIFSSGGLGSVPVSWSVVGQRDFDGNGSSDLLWRDTSGNTAIWLLNGLQVTSTGSIGNVPTTWSVVGTADFDGSGKGDILWRDSSGNTAIWLMNDTQVASSAGIGNIPTTWSVAGTGDFNGDGKADILWRDSSGNTAIWFMNGVQVVSSASIGNIPTTWSVAGAGDFNGDGMADILWRDTSGNTAVWLMNGAQVSASGGLGNIPLSWTVALTGDFNGDGISDILWRDISGDTAIWFMNGTLVSGTTDLGVIPGSWAVQGAAAD
jgi:hypothetical protein